MALFLASAVGKVKGLFVLSGQAVYNLQILWGRFDYADAT